MDADLLTARGLAVARGGRTLLADVDLDLRRGEVVALLGPNGVGKSTLLAVLAGVLDPVAGSVERGGRVAAGLQAPALARRSVRANVELALSWWGVPRPERRERAEAALDRLGVLALADRPATTLSGGEARRVHLARALAPGAEVLLLDEPFAGLDPPARASLLEDAGRALRDPDRATLVVVHDRAEAWALADRLVVLLDGGVAADGAPGDVLRRPPTERVAAFLGFAGRIELGDGSVLRLRPGAVRVARDGDVRARVRRVVPEEDGVLLGLEVDGGELTARVDHPGPRVGELVRVHLGEGARF